MEQRTFYGTTLLDVAKGAVEQFLKLRQRDNLCRNDRYMLVTFDTPPQGIKAAWREPLAVFNSELKNLQATGLTHLGVALKQCFDLLNLQRGQSAVDNYGQGRNPFFVEPALILCITDGHTMTNKVGVEAELNLPMNQSYPGSELTKEPFRWDHRFFSLVLRIPGFPSDCPEPLAPDDSPINLMCEVTGGRSYAVTTMKALHQCIDSVVGKLVCGVVLNFEQTGPDPPPPSQDIELGSSRSNSPLPPPVPPSGWQSSRRMVLVRPNPKTGLPLGHWPIPEAFWPEQSAPSLPPRTAHPVVEFTCSDSEPLIVDSLPFDKYELEPSPLTQFILSRGMPTTCWPCYVPGSGKSAEIDFPFGYLKASINLNCVNLFVMPFNYPVLLPLLEELIKVYKLKAPPIEWRQRFDSYMKQVPIYYAAPLRIALKRMGAPSLIPDSFDTGLSYSIQSYLKKLKTQSKQELDRLQSFIGKDSGETGIRVIPRSTGLTYSQNRDYLQMLHGMMGGGGNITGKTETNEFPGFCISTKRSGVPLQPFRNPYDIPREKLLETIAQMRRNFNQINPSAISLIDDEHRHSLPVQHMGNYTEYLKRQPTPLRDPEPAPARLHMFGNPFKLQNKDAAYLMNVDEAEGFGGMGGAAGERGDPRGGFQMKRGAVGGRAPPKRCRAMSPLLRPSPLPWCRSPRPTGGESPVSSPEAVFEFSEEIMLEPVANRVEGPSEASRFQAASDENRFQPVGLPASDLGSPTIDDAPSPVSTVGTEDSSAFTVHVRTGLRIQRDLLSRIRRPGKDFREIRGLVNELDGPPSVQLAVLHASIEEAKRWRRNTLVTYLNSLVQLITQ